jgi:serine/threonine-protein kinase HipA
MKAARKAGLVTPEFHLSENGGIFVMKRFDIRADGASCGFEDFCSLQGFGTDGKYSGSYERIARSISEFVSPEHRTEARERFFGVLVLSVAVRNGDAHLKNFGVLYDDAKGPVRLSPIYDIVTTTAYLRNDVPALTIGGRKIWWPRKSLEKFAIVNLFIPSTRAHEIIDRVADAVNEEREEVLRYMDDHPEFALVGEGMLTAWRAGVDGLSTHGRKSP